MNVSAPRLYVRFILGVFLLAAAVAGVNYLLLVRSFEIASIDEVLDAQSATDALYGPATRNAGAAYKLRMYQRVKPAAIAVGSSRAMQFRADFFSDSFVNLGGAFSGPTLARSTIEAIVRDHKPRLLILTIDPWWFTPAENIRNFAGRLRTPGAAAATTDVTAAPPPLQSPNLFLPIRWLIERKLSIADYWPLIRQQPRLGEWFPNRLGILAYKQLSGFAKDGSSYHDAGVVVGLSPAEDRGFAKTLALLARRESGFECGDHVDAAQWDAYVRIIEQLRAAGVQAVTLMPPLAGRLIDRMMQSKECYRYIDELRARLKALSVPHFDFFDMRGDGVTDCEFLDGYHPGDVVYARMLRSMAKLGPPVIASAVKGSELDRLIEKYRGHAMILEKAPSSYKQIDFLGLGNCPSR